MKDIRIVVLSVVASCVVLASIIFLSYSERPTHMFLLPKDYTGWIEVIYEQPGNPAIEQENNEIIYEVPPSGRIKTSSKNVTGTVVLYYVETNGQKIELPTNLPMIHRLGTSSGAVTNANGTIKKTTTAKLANNFPLHSLCFWRLGESVTRAFRLDHLRDSFIESRCKTAARFDEFPVSGALDAKVHLVRTQSPNLSRTTQITCTFASIVPK